MSIFEYDKEEEEKKLRKAEYEAGIEAGTEAGTEDPLLHKDEQTGTALGLSLSAEGLPVIERHTVPSCQRGMYSDPGPTFIDGSDVARHKEEGTD